MIYRKAPPQPGRLLLRVVALSGAGAMAGALACGNGSAPSTFHGSVTAPPEEAGADAFVGGGTVGGFYDSGVNGMLDGGGPNGLVDGGGSDAASDVVGLVPPPDGGLDASDAALEGSFDDVVTGVVVSPDASGD